MPLVLDVFGVILLSRGVNTPLLDLCAAWRRDGEKVFAASNMTTGQRDELRRLPGVTEAFDEIYCSGQIGLAKPEPQFFKAVTEKIGVSPDNILFFDDSGVNVTAARQFGWAAQIFTDNRDLATVADGFFFEQRRGLSGGPSGDESDGL